MAKKPTLLFVDVSNCQTTYTEGDYFNSTGATFTVRFDDGSISHPTTCAYTPTSALTFDNEIIDFYYTYGGKTVHAYVDIIVQIDANPTSLSITQESTFSTLQYYGEKLDPTGLSISVSFSNGLTRSIPLNRCVIKVNGTTNGNLSYGSNTITVSFTNKNITVSNSFSLTARYFPKRVSAKSSPFDNPKWCLATTNLFYTHPLVSFNKHGHPLEVFLTYCCPMFPCISERMNEVKGNWFISLKQFIIQDGPNYYKYVNEIGEVIPFASPGYYDLDGRGYRMIISGSQKMIKKPDGSLYTFNSSGYLASISQHGLTLIIEYISNSNLINKVYYQNNQTTFLLFEYNSDNILISIHSYSNNLKTNTTFLNYVFYLSSISIRGNSDNNTPLLLYGFNYQNNLLTTITDSLTKKRIRFIYVLDKIHSGIAKRNRVIEIDKGVYNNSSFEITEKNVFSSFSTYFSSPYTIHSCLITNEKEVSIRYFMNADGMLYSSYEEVSDSIYKSLMRNKGYSVSLSNSSSYQTSTVNGALRYKVNNSKTVNCSEALTDLVAYHDLTDRTFFTLSFFATFDNASEGVCFARLVVDSETYYEPINCNNGLHQQFVQIFFECNSSNANISLTFVDSIGTYKTGYVSDLTLNYGSRNTLLYKTNNAEIDLKKITEIKFGSTNVPCFLTEKDILLTFNDYYRNTSSTKFFYYNNGYSVRTYSSASLVKFYSFGIDTYFTLEDLFTNFYSLTETKIGRYSIIKSNHEITNQRTLKHYSFSSNALTISTSQISRVIVEGLYDETSEYRLVEQYNTDNLLVRKTLKIVDGSNNEEIQNDLIYEYNTYGDLLTIKKTSHNYGDLIVESNTYNSDGLPYYKDGPISGVHIEYNNNKDIINIHPRIFTNSSMSTLSNISNSYQRDIYYRQLNNVFSISNQQETYNSNTYDTNGFVKDTINSGSIGYRTLHSGDLKTISHYSLANNTQSLLENDVITLPASSSGYDTVLTKNWTINNTSHTIVKTLDEYERLFSDRYDFDFVSLSYIYSNNKESDYANQEADHLVSINNLNFETSYYDNGEIEYISIYDDTSVPFLRKNYSLVGHLFYQIPFSSYNFDSFNTLYHSSMEYGVNETCNIVDGFGAAHYVYNYDIFHRLIDKVQNAYSGCTNHPYNSYIYSYLTKDGRKTELLSGLTYNGLKNNNNQYIYQLQDTITYDDRVCIYQISSIKTINGNANSLTRTFTYDDFLRLSSSIIGSTRNVTYQYNSYGLMSSENNSYSNENKTFNYNSSFFGQISSIVITDTTYQTSETYSYSYDSLGNRTGKTINNVTTTYTYYYHFLNSISDSSKTISFKYGPNGIRYKKTVTQNSIDTVTKYIYDGTKLIALQVDNWKLIFLYDMHGVCGFKALANPSYSGGSIDRTFTYIRNELGDVVSVLDDNSNEVISYTYDEWGNIITQSSSSTYPEYYYSLMLVNPFRYRGYIYDYETGLYYLNTRYYDPFTHTFLTIDDYKYLDISNISGVNLYCYCSYNPIMYKDENGNSFLGTLVIATVAGALIGFGLETGKQLTKNNWNWSELNPWEIGSKALLGAASGFALAVGGVIGAAAYGSISLTASAAAIWTGVGAAFNFSAGVGAYFLHATGTKNGYNPGAAVLWGLAQFGKGAVSYVSGFAFGASGLWKMGSADYFKNLGPYGELGAFAKTFRDAFFYRAPVRFGLEYFLNRWLEEWFV